jgi:hypothetical protein
MKKNLLILTLFIIGICNPSFAQTWTSIATDQTGDGSQGSLLDGTELEYYYDDIADSVWFRITTANMNSSHASALGINIMVNYPGGGSTFNFWGSSNSAAYHRLVTAWVTGAPPSSYSGTIGIANATGVNSANFTNEQSNNLDLTTDVNTKTVVVGIKRDQLIPQSAMGQPILTAAAVGSNQFWNDDIYSPSGTMTLNQSSVGIDNNTQTNIKIFPNPTSQYISINREQVGDENISVVIFDLLGRPVFETATSTDKIDVSHLSKGTYLLQLVCGKKEPVITTTFVKD